MVAFRTTKTVKMMYCENFSHTCDLFDVTGDETMAAVIVWCEVLLNRSLKLENITRQEVETPVLVF